MSKAASGNPVGLGLVIIGAAAMAIATFLPFDEPVGVFAAVRNNSLIQHGGWWLIGLAIATAVVGYRASQISRGEWFLPLALSAVALVVIIAVANDKDMRTLYPIGPNGTPDTSLPGMVANLGIAIYVAGAGAVAAFIGSVFLKPSRHDDIPDEWADDEFALEESGQKKCPDCAETVLADARVCKHCGYRFAPAAPSSAPSLAPKPNPTQTTPPTRTNALRQGDQVQVIKPGHRLDGRTAKVVSVSDTGYVIARVGLSEYKFRLDELEP